MRGIARYSYLHGPWTMEREPPFYLKVAGAGRVGQKVEWRDADGIIMREPEDVHEVLKLCIPIIFAGYLKEEIPDTPRIMTDDAATGRMGAKHFLQRGFRHLGYLGYDSMYWSRNRKVSFCETAARAGADTYVFEQAKVSNRRVWQTEQPLVSQWLQSLPIPLGVMCCNDDRAQQALIACRFAGLRVPDEVAILGVDNDEFVCRLANPQLSSVALTTEKAGYEAAALLAEMMSNPGAPIRQIVVKPTRVAVRQSTDIMAIDDREVATAVRFIRQYSNQPIQVSNVVEATGLSRRALYERFRRALGRSVHKEIKRVRAERIARMLLETDLTIYQIAVKMGFSGPEHIAKYFREQKGVNPAEYRRRNRQF